MLCIFGPTAVGKTDALFSLRRLPIEVVSADSVQVYRELMIGAAKPDQSIRDAVPHHLLDVVSATEPFDVGRFVTSANGAISAIAGRRRLPVVVGGTGYYFKHLLFGMPEVPKADPAVRARIADELCASGLAALRARLRSVDPVTAERTSENDRYRTVRALEVFEQTGKPLSSFSRHAPTDSARRPALFLELMRPRGELVERIDRRVNAMFQAGLRREVERLVDSGATAAWPAMRAIGYREFFSTEGELRGSAQDDAIAAEIAAATRRYAKRQSTFANQFPGRVRLHADAHGTLASIASGLMAR